MASEHNELARIKQKIAYLESLEDKELAAQTKADGGLFLPGYSCLGGGALLAHNFFFSARGSTFSTAVALACVIGGGIVWLGRKRKQDIRIARSLARYDELHRLKGKAREIEGLSRF